ncbi:MAG TPA: peroxiredoxin [Burkholderiales bacterium]|nr:peroxiredoxin [Burkholderiales bacterium]
MGVMLQEGEAAPGFDLPDPDMEMVSLSSFTGRSNVVLYFYPKDDTPGCTIEALEFTRLEDAFSSLHTVVLGVSMDDCMSHGSFRDKHGLTVQLLADPEGDVCRKYGVLHEKQVEGKKKTGVLRSTFIIDRRGVVRHARYGVNPRGHAQEVLRLVEGIR